MLFFTRQKKCDVNSYKYIHIALTEFDVKYTVKMVIEVSMRQWEPKIRENLYIIYCSQYTYERLISFILFLYIDFINTLI